MFLPFQKRPEDTQYSLPGRRRVSVNLVSTRNPSRVASIMLFFFSFFMLLKIANFAVFCSTFWFLCTRFSPLFYAIIYARLSFLFRYGSICARFSLLCSRKTQLSVQLLAWTLFNNMLIPIHVCSRQTVLLALGCGVYGLWSHPTPNTMGEHVGTWKTANKCTVLYIRPSKKDERDDTCFILGF